MKRLLSGIFAFALILATGCEEMGIPNPDPGVDPGVDPGLTEGSESIAFDAKISPFDGNGSEVFDDRDNIGVYVITLGTVWANNVLFTQTDGVFIGSQGEKWYNNTLATATIVAYYPYMDGMSADSTGFISSIQFSVQANQKTAENFKKSDLRGVVINNVKPSSSPVSVNFKHLLSRLDVQIVCEDEAAVVEKIEIEGLSTSISFVGGREVQNPQVQKTVIPYSASDNKACMAILPPQSGTAKVKVTLSGGVTKEADLDVTLNGGKITGARMEIPKDEKPAVINLVLGDSPISDWTSQADLPFTRI